MSKRPFEGTPFSDDSSKMSKMEAKKFIGKRDNLRVRLHRIGSQTNTASQEFVPIVGDRETAKGKIERDKNLAMAGMESTNVIENSTPIFEDLSFLRRGKKGRAPETLPKIEPEKNGILPKQYVTAMAAKYGPIGSRDSTFTITNSKSVPRGLAKWSMYINFKTLSTRPPYLSPIGPVTVKQELRDLADQQDPSERGLVYLITSNVHSTIIITNYNGTQCWTCGFGYKGSTEDDENELTDIINKFGKNLPKGFLRDLAKKAAHHFETLQGSIYTADHVLPTGNVEAKISWVDFLSNRLLDRLQLFLDTTTGIYYNGTCELKNAPPRPPYPAPIPPPDLIPVPVPDGTNVKYNMSNNAVLVLASRYNEGAGWIPMIPKSVSSALPLLPKCKEGETYNCFTWASEILSVVFPFTFDPARAPVLPDVLFNKIIDSRGDVSIIEAVAAAQKYFASNESLSSEDIKRAYDTPVDDTTPVDVTTPVDDGDVPVYDDGVDPDYDDVPDETDEDTQKDFGTQSDEDTMTFFDTEKDDDTEPDDSTMKAGKTRKNKRKNKRKTHKGKTHKRKTHKRKTYKGKKRRSRR